MSAIVLHPPDTVPDIVLNGQSYETSSKPINSIEDCIAL